MKAILSLEAWNALTMMPPSSLKAGSTIPARFSSAQTCVYRNQNIIISQCFWLPFTLYNIIIIICYQLVICHRFDNHLFHSSVQCRSQHIHRCNRCCHCDIFLHSYTAHSCSDPLPALVPGLDRK